MKTTHFRVSVSILGIITLAGGVAATVLLYLSFKHFTSHYQTNSVITDVNIYQDKTLRVQEPTFYFWWAALPLVFPGALSIIVAIKTTRLMTGFYTAFSVVAVLVISIFSSIAIIYINDLDAISTSDCMQTTTHCECRRVATHPYQPIRMDSCAELRTVIHLGYAGVGSLLLAMIMCVVGMITSYRICVTMDERCRDIG